MRTLLMVTALLLMVGCVAFAQEVQIKQPIKKTKKYKDGEVTKEWTAWGSGVVVGTTKTDSYVLTNRHCHHEDFLDLVVISKGVEYAGKVVKTGYIADLALIKVENVLLPSVKISKTPAKPGDYVEYKGFPNAGPMVHRRGFVKSIDEKIDWVFTGTKTLFVDLQGFGGESGSGLLNAKGELVGVVAAKSEGLCHCLPLPDVAKFIEGEIK